MIGKMTATKIQADESTGCDPNIAIRNRRACYSQRSASSHDCFDGVHQLGSRRASLGRRCAARRWHDRADGRKRKQVESDESINFDTQWNTNGALAPR